ALKHLTSGRKMDYFFSIRAKKVGIKDMLLFKADVDTNFGSKANIYFLNGGIVIRIDSVSTYNELKNSGVPFATFTKKNTESLIDANGGLK
ncbi:hypothetical protein N2F28_08500, partial [Leuconostoc falkenbergense]